MEMWVLDGWKCLNTEGCQCGDSICYPDFCLGSDRCDVEDTLKLKDGRGNCEGHVLPTDVIVKGYGCYSGDNSTNPTGWYCGKPEGCSCGDVTCEQNQMCLTPGNCSKNKLDEQEQNSLELLQIKRDDCDGLC